MWLLILKVLNSSEFPLRMLKKRWVWLEFISNVTIQMFAFPLYIFTTVKENLLTFFINMEPLCEASGIKNIKLLQAA